MSISKNLPVYKRIVQEGWRKASLKEFLSKYLERAGFHDVKLVETSLREIITIYVERPGIVIGKSGKLSKKLTDVLKERFGFENPYIRAEKVEEPFLSARIIAHFIASRIMRGEKHRRVAFMAINRALSSGAKGIEIKIAGKFGSQRAREERFRAGVIYRCGEDVMSHVDYAVEHILLPQGVMGVRVRLVKPIASMPDKVLIKEEKISEILEKIKAEKVKEEVEKVDYEENVSSEGNEQ